MPRLLTITAVSLLAGHASAQTADQGSPIRTDWQSSLHELRQGVADVGPLGKSLEVAPVDLRVSNDFDRVYQIGSDGPLMRSAGNLYAVFDRSVYVQSQYGPTPEVPAGTVFYIGQPPPSLLAFAEEHEQPRPANLIDWSVPHTGGVVRRPEQRGRIEREPPPPMTMFTDESYRRVRVGQLMKLAHDAEASG